MANLFYLKFFHSIGKFFQSKENPPPVEAGPTIFSKEEESDPYNNLELGDFTVDIEAELEKEKLLKRGIQELPIQAIALQILAIALGKTVTSCDYKIEKKLSSYFVSAKMHFNKFQSYSLNLIVDTDDKSSYGNKIVTTKMISTERTVKVSEGFLRKNYEQVLDEMTQAFSDRQKGFRAEQRFESLLKMVLQSKQVGSAFNVERNSFADKHGIDFYLRFKRSNKSVLFQVKSSDRKLVHETYLGQVIHKVIVNSVITDEELKIQIWDLIHEFVGELSSSIIKEFEKS